MSYVTTGRDRSPAKNTQRPLHNELEQAKNVCSFWLHEVNNNNKSNKCIKKAKNQSFKTNRGAQISLGGRWEERGRGQICQSTSIPTYPSQSSQFYTVISENSICVSLHDGLHLFCSLTHNIWKRTHTAPEHGRQMEGAKTQKANVTEWPRTGDARESQCNDEQSRGTRCRAHPT